MAGPRTRAPVDLHQTAGLVPEPVLPIPKFVHVRLPTVPHAAAALASLVRLISICLVGSVQVCSHYQWPPELLLQKRRCVLNRLRRSDSVFFLCKDR